MFPMYTNCFMNRNGMVNCYVWIRFNVLSMLVVVIRWVPPGFPLRVVRTVCNVEWRLSEARVRGNSILTDKGDAAEGKR